MDPLSWLLTAAAGTAGGLLLGLVPGLHGNSLGLLLPLAGFAPAPFAVALAAAATAHAFAAILPTTYLGVPDGDQPAALLPAHRLLLDGQGPLAVRSATRASLAATVAAVLLLLPLKWLLAEPVRLQDRLDALLPAVLAGASLWLLWSARRKWRAALLAFALSGFLGIASAGVPTQAWLPLPSSPLGPVLAGLFGGAGLVEALVRHGRLPRQATSPPAGRRLRCTVLGWSLAGVAAAVATLPVASATPGAAATLLPRGRDPAGALAALAAIGAAHQALALGLVWPTQESRTGLSASLLQHGAPTPWLAGAAPPSLLAVLAAILAAALAARPLTHLFDRLAAPRIDRLAGRWLNGGALAALAAVTGLLAGWGGLALFLLAVPVGLVPLACGARRITLLGVLLVPAFLRSVGVGLGVTA